MTACGTPSSQRILGGAKSYGCELSTRRSGAARGWAVPGEGACSEEKGRQSVLPREAAEQTVLGLAVNLPSVQLSFFHSLFVQAAIIGHFERTGRKMSVKPIFVSPGLTSLHYSTVNHYDQSLLYLSLSRAFTTVQTRATFTITAMELICFAGLPCWNRFRRGY